MKIQATAQEIKGYREEYGGSMFDAIFAIERQKALDCLETSEILGTDVELYAVIRWLLTKVK